MMDSTGRDAYIRGWIIGAIRKGQDPDEAIQDAERDWKDLQAAVRTADAALARRKAWGENCTCGIPQAHWHDPLPPVSKQEHST